MEVGADRAIQRPVPGNDPRGSARMSDEQIDKAAREFEAMFIGSVVNEMMKETTPKTMNGGAGEEMFRSLLGNAIGESIANAGGVGIADDVARAMKAYR